MMKLSLFPQLLDCLNRIYQTLKCGDYVRISYNNVKDTSTGHDGIDVKIAMENIFVCLDDFGFITPDTWLPYHFKDTDGSGIISFCIFHRSRGKSKSRILRSVVELRFVDWHFRSFHPQFNVNKYFKVDDDRSNQTLLDAGILTRIE